jgi:hypothetical protein
MVKSADAEAAMVKGAERTIPPLTFVSVIVSSGILTYFRLDYVLNAIYEIKRKGATFTVKK